MSNDWIYKGAPLLEPPSDCYGFVYKITNTTNGKQYIGKKFFFASKSRQIKGKKKRYLAESDWKSYFGSSKLLLSDIELVGSDKFVREILHLCQSKGECSYFEAKYQFDHQVLSNPDLWYNDWIICRVHRKHLNAKKQKTTATATNSPQSNGMLE
jgi:hypothetical protein